MNNHLYVLRYEQNDGQGNPMRTYIAFTPMGMPVPHSSDSIDGLITNLSNLNLPEHTASYDIPTDLFDSVNNQYYPIGRLHRLTTAEKQHLTRALKRKNTKL